MSQAAKAPHGYLLVELDEQLMAEFETQRYFSVKGADDDDAVLCTRSTTLKLRSVESSNQLFLCTPGDGRCHAIVDHHLEVLQISPPLAPLKKLVLASGFYNGPTASQALPSSASSELWSTEMLLREPSIQMSGRELRRALSKKLRAFEIDGHWRILGDEYLWDILQDIFLTAEEQGWSLQSLPTVDLLSALTSGSSMGPEDNAKWSVCVAQVLRMYGNKVRGPDASQPAGGPTWGLDFSAIASLLGQMLLRLKPNWKWEEFIAGVQARLPEEAKSFPLTPDLWFGHARFLRKKPPGASQAQPGAEIEALETLNESELPQDPRLRFKALFQKQNSWRDVELLPFIEPLVTPTVDLNALLVKFSRSVQDPLGSRHYYPR
ncbi:MAG: sister chromatid cohesion protein DCC1 [archaeon]|nr:sister chromatid cohesion protein DCC1 [archaeon]